ncbi:hypothetical protein EYB45_08170 [Erythrobacteraceae bacterium CFH 75059]|uniref:hypothetical protein n=1 Tax=Qipengyuania thermophila TaxID=2509361 RepID=UPI00101FF19E|nr:hypothetical protein [Qipengyuania thermophila]TCD05436.1 hypothetical protein EYB45_08170 [Erythrobacteraceae bacterium CFH 75059]
MKTHLFTVAVLASGASLAAGCGSPAPAESETGRGALSEPVDLAGAANASGSGVSAAAPADAAAVAEPAPPAQAETPAPTTAAAGETVDSLPLRRGYYVASDTPCGQASNATLMLVTREGVSASRSSCETLRIARTGARRFEVRERCEDEVRTTTYDIPANDRFTSTSDSGWSNSARFCPQASLPEPWRDNDISDLLN